MVDQRKLGRETFEAVLRQMPSGVVIAEARSGKILLSNKRAEQIRRCPLSPGIGIEEYGEYDDNFRGFYPDGRPYEPEEWPLARSIRTGKVVVEEEIAIVRGDGTHGMIRVSSSPIRDDEGSIVAGVAVFFDFTEQKRAEETRRETEERYRIVAETASDTIVMIDEESQILFINDAAEEIFGYAKEEMLGQQLTMLMPEYLREAHRASLKRYVDTGRRHLDWNSAQLLRLHKSGREVSLKISFGEFVKGGKHYFTGFIRDTTERKQAEEALRESEKRFRATFEQAAVGIVHTAPDGKWLRFNQKFSDILGYSREELMGYTFQDITHPDDLEANLEQIRRLLAGEVETFSIEKRYIRKDGSTVWANVTVSLVREPSGEPEYFIAVIEDITERKRVEEEVRRLNEELEERVRERTARLVEKSMILDTTLDNLAEGVLLIDTSGQVLFANPTACTMLNIERERLPAELTELWRDITRWRGFDLPEAVAHCTKEQECIEAVISSGEDFARVNLRPLPSFCGMRDGTLVMMQDLSAERRLEANQQRFLANATHELKTPLTTIMGAAELLLSEEELPGVQRHFLQHIASEAHRMWRLSDTLLRLARTGWDFREPSIQEQELEVVQTAVERMKPLAEKGGITLLLEDRGGYARVDPEWLEQALLILISNAVKYSDPGGHVRVYAEDSTIIVEDEGTGIKEADLPHVFERFYRGENGREGSGVGLSLCKELIERMGGSISISSREQAGTTVRIELS